MPPSDVEIPPRRALLIDAVLGIAVAGVLSFIITADQGGTVRPDALAYGWAIGLGALMLVRRRYPIIVLAVTVLGLFAYYAVGYPAVGVAVPVAAALFSAAEFGRLAGAIAIGFVAIAVSVTFRLLHGQDPAFVVGYELIGHLLLMAGAIALGDGLRSRRRLAASTRRVVELTTEEQRRADEAAAQADRERIARDLHDSIGHATTVVSLHADVAREAIDHDPSAAREALDVISRTSSATLTELRNTVRSLRHSATRTGSSTTGETANGPAADGPASTRPTPTGSARIAAAHPDAARVASSEDPAGSARAAVDGPGTPVSSADAAERFGDPATPRLADARDLARAFRIPIELDLATGTLPTEADHAAYRITQEALTNIARHSTATRARIRTRREDDALTLTIADDGMPPGSGRVEPGQNGEPGERPENGDPGHQTARDDVVEHSENFPDADPTFDDAPGGHGIPGMRERAAQLGGSLTAGWEPDGFVVRARIPLPADGPGEVTG